MSRFEKYYRLIYGEGVGWINERRIIKELTPEEFEVLLSLLTHWKTRLRWSAADRLGKMKDVRAVAPLIEALQDPHWLVRLHAAKALGRIGEPIATNPLIEAMNDECPYVRRRVAAALGTLNGKDARIKATLIFSLSDPDPEVRTNIIHSLGYSASRPAIAAIAAAVRDQDANVSWRAVEALRRIGAPTVEVLIDLLDCPDKRVRYRVVKTLGQIGDRRAIKPLEAMLDDPDEEVRGRVRFALRQLGYRTAWKKLPPSLEKLGLWWRKLWMGVINR